MKAPKRYGLKRRPKTQITDTGRVCTCCGEYKQWSYFSKDKSCKLGYTTHCKECRNKKKLEYRVSKEYRQKENEYKKQLRQTEKGKWRMFFDNIYYRDKTILKNREILKEIKDPIKLRKEARENKIYYFVNRGYKESFLKQIY